MPEVTVIGDSPSQSEVRAPHLESGRSDVEQLYEALSRGKARLAEPGGEARVLPHSLHSFLVELIGLLSERKSVMIVQDQATLTTIEAASIIGVSRQFLVNLLEQGEIQYHLVGTHRRIYAQDLFQYKAQRDARRHKLIRELAQAEVKDGLYGKSPGSDED